MRWQLRLAQLCPQLAISLIVLISTVQVIEQLTKFAESIVIDSGTMLGDAVASALAQLFDGPSGFGDSDHRHVQRALLHHRLECWKALLVSQVPAGAEKNQCV